MSGCYWCPLVTGSHTNWVIIVGLGSGNVFEVGLVLMVFPSDFVVALTCTLFVILAVLVFSLVYLLIFEDVTFISTHHYHDHAGSGKYTDWLQSLHARQLSQKSGRTLIPLFATSYSAVYTIAGSLQQ